MRLGAYALTLALVSGAVQAQAPDLLGWLRKMHEATQKLSYSGTFIYQNGSRSEGRAYSVALYGSYSPGDVFFLDGLWGYQNLDYDLRRFVTTNGNFVHRRF